LDSQSHDEIDAITAAVVARYFETGQFEAMGVPSEAQLIVPTVSPLHFEPPPVICLAGKTGAGKSVVARYLTVFYGFRWIRTRGVIRDLLLDDLAKPTRDRIYQEPADPKNITERDLREFGAVVLNVFKQVPLRTRLSALIQATAGPVVIDSIRDVHDVGSDGLGERPTTTWFIECPETVLRHRLLSKRKLGHRRPAVQNAIDQNASAIRQVADARIQNGGSLEQLRWAIDDTLFSRLSLKTK
jgi:dephospho-CoA kinase